MNYHETENRRQIPLAERVQRVKGIRSIPFALGLRDVDFFQTIGEMTGDEEKYNQAYASHIRDYGSTNEERKDIYNLVVLADQLDDEALENLLYWILVEPFAALAKQNQKERNEQR